MAFDVGISRAPSLTAPNHPPAPPPKNDRVEIVSTLYKYIYAGNTSCRRLYEWSISPQTNGSCESACTLLLLLSSSWRVFMYRLAAPQHTAAIITRPKLGYNMWVIARGLYRAARSGIDRDRKFETKIDYYYKTYCFERVTHAVRD